MARDLSFWKEKNNSEKSAADTYKALLDGEEGLLGEAGSLLAELRKENCGD